MRATAAPPVAFSPESRPTGSETPDPVGLRAATPPSVPSQSSREGELVGIVGLQMIACIVVAFLLVFGLLVLGPQLSKWIGNATGASGVVSAI